MSADVARFFEKYHSGKYIIINLSGEVYDYTKFQYRVKVPAAVCLCVCVCWFVHVRDHALTNV
jgi:hypothetical protein